jgi:hypothetical protein
MARRKRTPPIQQCRRCRLERLPEETFRGGRGLQESAWTPGLCPACLEVDRRERRSRVGRKLLNKANDGGTVDRDGQTFRVTVLPPKRSSGRRIR